MRVLITGVTGFVGRHLASVALSHRARVFGLCRPGSQSECPARVQWVTADLLNPKALKRVIRDVKPEAVFHLAGQSSVALSWVRPEETLEANFDGTRNLLDALMSNHSRARVHVACSAEEYGESARAARFISEKSPLRPTNPYAVSKTLQDLLCESYIRVRNLAIIRTRAFNHIGPGQNDRFVASNFAKQMAMIELGMQKPVIEAGNLSAVRDFLDVRDVAKAYWLILERGIPGEVYNVASGKPRKVGNILKYYLKTSSIRIKVIYSRSRMRQPDIPRLVGDASKIRRQTGWKPKISFEATLKNIRDDWKSHLKKTRKGDWHEKK